MKSKPNKINKSNNKKNVVGAGGETHQIQLKRENTLTTQHGMPISDDQNSLRVGSRGPTLMEDMVLRDKIFHFDHERIPERVVHARGFGAHGYFETYKSLAKITKADLFQEKGQKTPVFVRFSTVAGNKGSPDLARDVRGFAVKFYTQHGNWDLVGNNIPVFFIQDAMKFPDLIHAAKDEPDSGFPQAQTAHDNFWDFISLMPESMHMVMWIMSDRTIPRSFRFMEGFGVHTFRLVNKNNESTFVKFHWKPKLGLQSVIWNEAVKINGADPDFHRRDLWNAIQSGNFPEWELGMQLFDESYLKKFPFDVLDATKLIPEEDVPITIVGRLVLNKCVDNFFAETEQVAFCTQNIIPGIDFSDDPLLQGRNFSYLDTQLKRLGSPNFNQIPINAPRCPVHFFQQDGHMTLKNPVGRVNYEPNSWDENKVRENPEKGFTSYPEELKTVSKLRYRSESFGDHYSQARQFYLSQTPIEQEHIQKALIFELSKVEREEIRKRLVSHLPNIHSNLAKMVAKGLGFISVPDAIESNRRVLNLPLSPALSILKNSPRSFEGRKLGVLVSNHTDAQVLKNLMNTIKKQSATLEIIAPTIAGVTLNDGKKLIAQNNIEGGSSVLYDAVAILIADKEVENFKNNPTVHEFINNAYIHYKFIGYTEAVTPIFNLLSIKLDGGMCLIKEDSVKSFIKKCDNLRFWERKILDEANQN
jgi:catalase